MDGSRALRRPSRREGQVTLSWTIVRDGAIRNIGVQVDTVHDVELVDCMRTTVAQWRFAPLPRGPIDVQFPFKFKAGGCELKAPPAAGFCSATRLAKNSPATSARHAARDQKNCPFVRR
jgi:hypothetical protein